MHLWHTILFGTQSCLRFTGDIRDAEFWDETDPQNHQLWDLYPSNF